MKIKYLSLSVIFSMLLALNLSAQFQDVKIENQENSIGKRIFFGGNLGLQFGALTSIEISPLVGYRLSNNWSAGIGLTYMYYEDSRYTPTYSTNIFGGRLFSRYYIYGDFFAHAEYELLSYEDQDFFTREKTRRNVSSYFIGGGFRQWLGPRAAATIMILYNLNDNEYSVYSNPIFRIGFQFGL